MSAKKILQMFEKALNTSLTEQGQTFATTANTTFLEGYRA